MRANKLKIHIIILCLIVLLANYITCFAEDTLVIEGMESDQNGFVSTGGLARCNSYDVKQCPVCKEGCPPAAVVEDEELAMYPGFTSSCPCPALTVHKKACSITFNCKFNDDQDFEFTTELPCPRVAGTIPEYPLVKMLSGTLLEWSSAGGGVSSPGELWYSAPNGTKAVGGKFGAEVYEGVGMEVVVSSVYTGQKWDVGTANAKSQSKDPLNRTNVQLLMVGNGDFEILTPLDIYNAYKSKSDYVQAYLALDDKDYGERDYGTYEKFVTALCKKSLKPDWCISSLSKNRYSYLGLQGSLFLGNGQPTILGVYSEYSSHPCHGASEIHDGQPGYGIIIKTTWCFYFHMDWAAAFKWSAVVPHDTAIGWCCKDHNWWKVCTATKPCGHDGRCCTNWVWHCHKAFYVYDIYTWNPVSDLGNESSGDCALCYTLEGYIGENGETKEPFAISYYQSQSLLITP